MPPSVTTPAGPPGAASSAPTLTIAVPPEFHQVPLQPETEDRLESATRLLDALGLADAAQREGLALYFEALANRLRDSDVLASAFCAVSLHGHPSTATLTVGLRPLGTADGAVAVFGAAAAWQAGGRYDRVEVERLGPHWAVTAHARRYPAADESAAGQAQPEEAALREAAVFVPLPQQRSAAVLTLVSPSMDDWPVYERLVRDLAASVRVHAGPGRPLSR